MRFELKQKHYISIGVGIFIFLLDSIFFLGLIPDFGSKRWFYNPILVIALLIGLSTFISDFFKETKRQKELELKFLEFIRSLLGSVRSGVNISQAILNVSSADYGSLTPYVKKLAHQIEWGFPLHKALTTFAKDTNNDIIERSIRIIIQAERSGGDIASVLDSVTGSTYEIKKVKEEQKTSSYSQTVQGYIIFFVFIATMLVLQVYLIPKMEIIGTEISGGIGGILGNSATAAAKGGLDLNTVVIVTVIVQGLFAGLMLGKFAENDFRSGVKHSLIMVVVGYLLISTVVGIMVAPFLFMIPKRWFK
jgi:flagellar protein FlaJ